jgi:hydrogenase maturation protein HypF
MELEALVDLEEKGSYSFAVKESIIDPAPLFAALVRDVREGVSVGRIAARFHRGVAGMVRDVCLDLRRTHGVNRVVLSGGVWQNATLLRESAGLLARAGFVVHFHTRVPPNDGGLALGQAWIVAQQLDGRPATN